MQESALGVDSHGREPLGHSRLRRGAALNNIDFASLLDDIAQLLALTDTSPFRVKAYENAARMLRSLEEPVAPRIADGTVTSLKGIGKGIAADLTEMLATGTCESLDTLRAAIPPGYADLIRVRGLGPKRIQTLRTALGVENLDALEEAATSGRLSGVAGFTEKAAAAMAEEIRRIRAAGSGVVVGTAHRAGSALADWVASVSGAAAEVSLAGSVARGDELHCEAVVVVATVHPEAVVAALLASDAQARRDGDSILLDARAGLARRVVVTDVPAAPARWLCETATAPVRDALRSKAGGDLLALSAATRGDLFAQLGLAPLPAELLCRAEDLSQQAASLEGLVEVASVRRDLHLHTTWSDGANTIAEMAAAAAAHGYDAIAVTDHSPSLTVARGLSAERLRAQVEELRAGALPVRVFTGLEVDILADGTLDMEAELLASLDWVVGSVHSHMNQSAEVMTDRLLRAVNSGNIDALGHPTGRILGGRPGFRFDYDAVFDACAREGVALELNAAPERLDLNDELLRAAMLRPEMRFVINTDAHSVAELDQMHHGIRMARRAAMPAGRVWNCAELASFEDHVASRRTR